ncbi:uncharacterized protein METZ01_LOCUS156094, partial [marine metagenome]
VVYRFLSTYKNTGPEINTEDYFNKVSFLS